MTRASLFQRPTTGCGAAALGLLVVAGGSVPPPLPATPVLRAAETVAANHLNGPTAAAWPEESWWRDFGDQQLSTLIEEAIANAPALAEASARLRIAEGYARSAHAALLPTARATGGIGELKQSYNEGFPAQFVPKGWNDTGSAQVNFSLDLDLFGRNHAELRAATSEREAAAIEARAARLSIATQVATAYADLGRYAALREVAANALQVRQETATLVSRRVENGLDTRAEARQAEAGIAVATADLAAADQALALTRNRLAALLGAGPDRAGAVTPPAPARFALMPLPTRLARSANPMPIGADGRHDIASLLS